MTRIPVRKPKNKTVIKPIRQAVLKGRKLGYLLAVSSMSAHIKQQLLDILPAMSMAQVESLTITLESQYLSGQDPETEVLLTQKIERTVKVYIASEKKAFRQALRDLETVTTKFDAHGS